jgi:tRNA pseudouridine38-40 synthase
MSAVRNLRLVLAYDGTDFHGWQRQPERPTVQGAVEDAVARILGEKVTVYGSGRTDAGVHALHQVANFKTQCRIPCANLQKALNDILPPTVRVKQVDEVGENFHARYDVKSKTYRYRILQSPLCSPFLWRFVWHYPHALDVAKMAEAAALLVGEHDFAAFASADGAAAATPGSDDQGEAQQSSEESREARESHRSTVRRVSSSSLVWRPKRQSLVYDVSGRGFLHHMVRNIVGTLVEVGQGKLGAADVERILASRDRRQAGPTAPPQGLFLAKVEY